jgi:RNA polymerase sigma factor (sigma-70 family)
MNPEITQPSLLSRVRNPADHEAWRLFEAKYRELVLRFCRHRGLQPADAEDVLQLAMQFLVRSLPRFTYDPARGRFRDYLYQTVRSAMSRRKARPDSRAAALDTHMIAAIPTDDESGTAELWEREWVSHHYRLAMETLRATFDPRSVEVFDRLVAGLSTDDAATAFGLSVEAVRKVRQRVRARR